MTAPLRRERSLDQKRRYSIGDRLFDLPGVPVLQEGESFQSVAWRASAINGIGQLVALKVLAGNNTADDPLETQLRRDHMLRPGTKYSPTQREAYGPSFMSSLATQGFRMYWGDDPGVFALRECVRVSSTLLCPKCLTEGPAYFRLAWRVGAVFMCVKHGRLLSEKCGTCKMEHGRPRQDRGLIPIQGIHIGSTVTCMNPAEAGSVRAVSKRPCGADLRRAQAHEVTSPALVSTQEQILALLNAEGPLQFRAGEWLTPLEVFDDLYRLCNLILYSAPASYAAGLGAKIEEDWERFCVDRGTRLADHAGKKGSLDRGIAKVPAPSVMAVAVSAALPIVVATTEEERFERLSVLMTHVGSRQRRALDRARLRDRLSEGLQIALLEATMEDHQVLAYLRNHPLRRLAAGSHFPVFEVTGTLIAEEFPEFVTEVDPEELVLPLQVMLRFFRTSSAKFWRDVFLPEDPPTTAAKVLRLVNLAGKLGVSRKLARWVVSLALAVEALQEDAGSGSEARNESHHPQMARELQQSISPSRHLR